MQIPDFLRRGSASSGMRILGRKGSGISVDDIPRSVSDLQDPSKMATLAALGDYLDGLLGQISGRPGSAISLDQKKLLFAIRERLSTLIVLLGDKYPDQSDYVDEMLERIARVLG